MTYKVQEPPGSPEAIPQYLSQELRRLGDHLAYWDLEESPRFESVTIPAHSMKTGSSAIPDFGAVTGVLQSYLMDSATVESLYFSAKIPRAYREGSSITPYVNFCATTATASAAVMWELVYAWANVGSALSAVTLTDSVSCQDSLVVTSKSLGSIDGSPREVGSVLLCKLSRLSSDASDTYSYDVGVLSVEFRYQKDSHGSRRETVK